MTANIAGCTVYIVIIYMEYTIPSLYQHQRGGPRGEGHVNAMYMYNPESNIHPGV